MIFVTIGNSYVPFNRLLKELSQLKNRGYIRDEVVAQIGKSDNYKKCFDKTIEFAKQEKFLDFIDKSRFVISHGGTGTIIACLKRGKRLIVVPRLKKYKEHMDDHQLEITKKFEKMGYILAVYDINELGDVIKRVENFNPKRYHSKKNEIVKILENFIKENFHSQL